VPKPLLAVTSEEEFRHVLGGILESEDATLPYMGWPWPWDDSQTTDFSYAYDDGVWISCFGYRWDKPEDYDPDADDAVKTTVFPKFGGQEQKVDMGKRSGVMIIGRKQQD
jgi:hypothetical protein